MKSVWALILTVGICIATAALFVRMSFAQTSPTACAPVQFETDIAISMKPDQNVLRWSPNAKWDYDFANRRELAAITDSEGNSTNILTKSVDGQTVQYVWTTSAQGVVTGCQAKYVDYSMPEFCETPNASSTITVGGQVDAYRWMGTFPGSQFLGGLLGTNFKGNITIEGLSTLQSNLPISMTAIQPDHSSGGLLNGPENFFQAVFMNTIPGIRNPNVFNYPQPCS